MYLLLLLNHKIHDAYDHITIILAFHAQDRISNFFKKQYFFLNSNPVMQFSVSSLHNSCFETVLLGEQGLTYILEALP